MLGASGGGHCRGSGKGNLSFYTIKKWVYKLRLEGGCILVTNEDERGNKGTTPSTEKRMIPGIKKFLNGMFINSDNGSPIMPPSGEIINIMPPPIAPRAKNPIKNKKIFLALLIVISSFFNMGIHFKILSE